MSNYTETKQEVKNYIVARTPLVVISSSERERCERMLSAISRENGFEMLYYTDSRQVTQLGQDSKSVNVENDPLAFIADVFRKKGNPPLFTATLSESAMTLYIQGSL